MNALARISQAEKLLATAALKDVPHVARLVDYAEAARIYAKQMKLGTASANHATQIKLLAEVKLAELVDQGQRQGKIATKVNGKRGVRSPDTKTLPELDVDKRRLAEARQLAKRIGEKEIRKRVAEATTADREVTRDSLLREVRRAHVEAKYSERQAAAIEDIDGCFDVILADPPWRYGNTGVRGSIVEQYPTMTTDALCGLAVPAAEAAVLFLWVTNPLLLDGLRVLEAWGFRYVTNLVWIKNVPTGAPFYVNGKHELLLMGVRGTGNVPIGEKPISVVVADRREHSQKPDEVYALIERMYPGLRYLEMFARRPRKGWRAWGNDAG